MGDNNTTTIPGINPELVRKYAEGASPWGITQLLTLFDHLRRCEVRAEDLSRAYLRRITELERRLGNNDRNTLRTPEREPSVETQMRDLRAGRKRDEQRETIARTPIVDAAELDI